jgi:uncharacterized protein (TIGR02145 family)
MKRKFWFYSLIIDLVFFIGTISCEKEYDYYATECSTSNGISTDIVTDIDGNVYNTVAIGTQIWMAENLKVTRYRNGDPIPNVTDKTSWKNLETGAYCNYDNDANNSITYGRLYNWFAVNDNRNICPVGWHVPTDSEWSVLIKYLGGSRVAGGIMKEAGTEYWHSPNTGAKNGSCFSALPGSCRLQNGVFSYLGSHANFWSSTEADSLSAYDIGLEFDNSGVTRGSASKLQGKSVRCIKD